MNAMTPRDRRQWEEAQRWLAQADEDERAEKTLIDAAEPITGAAAFHCQQAVEKMAKAVLIAHGLRPPRVHDITLLAEQVMQVEPEIGSALDELAGISRWYAAARYPDAGTAPTPAIDDIRDVLSWLQALRERIAGLDDDQGSDD